MKRPGIFRRTVGSRLGTTAVEAAIVLPVFLAFVFALLEFGHAQMVNNLMRKACREGARLGSTEGNTTAEVQAAVRQVLASAIDPNQLQVFVKNASVYDGGGPLPLTGPEIEALPNLELSEAEPRQMFLVRAKVPYQDIAIVPICIPYVGHFLDSVELQGQAFMRHE